MKIFTLLLVFFLTSILSYSQVAKTQVLTLNATPNPNGSITLTWPKENYAGKFYIDKKEDFEVQEWTFNSVEILKGTEYSWTDTNVKVGEAYEYRVVKANANNIEAMGYIYAGNKKKEVATMGNLIMVIDSSYIQPLATEIKTLINDITAEGWFVQVIYAGRNEKVTVVKDRIFNVYDKTFKGNAKGLFLLGHIPVPYSGFFSGSGYAPPPDGHVEGQGNHTGAWPADVYYGDFLGEWTDTDVTCVTGGDSRNHNIPGDGKFDQTKLPNDVQLEIGRVDLYNLPIFKVSDTLLMKKYLNRNHLFRTGILKATDHALISNNFTGLNLASTGYHNFSCFFPADSIHDNLNYIQSQKKESYLWSYGCGPGSPTSCGGIANSTGEFVIDSFQNVFTILAGSFFGDWDVSNSFLRGPLAAGSLANFWGGIPKWYVHHMAMGMNIGYGAKISQNNYNQSGGIDFYFDGAFNSSSYSVHEALMGDPTLKMKNINPPSYLTINNDYNTNSINLNWVAPSGNVDGYNVYEIDTVNNKYIKINDVIINSTSYSFLKKSNSGKYRYAVRAIKLESNASGSYYNLSGSVFNTVDYVYNSIAEDSQENLRIFPSITQSSVKIIADKFGSVKLLDINGRIIFQSEFSNQLEINLSEFPAGSYFVQLNSNDGRIYQSKVIKQ